MIPGNQNEPAFTTSRGGTFPGNDTIETSDARVVRRNDEGIGRDARFNEAEERCRYIHIIYMRTYSGGARVCMCVMRVRTHICTRDCQNEFATRL